MKTTTLKSLFILIAFMAIGSISYAQQKQPIKKSPNKPVSGKPAANTTTNTNVAPAGTSTTNTVVPPPAKTSTEGGDVEDFEKQRGAINEQGIQSDDQPKMKPATTTNVPVSPNSSVAPKPKTESKTSSPTVSPK